MKIIDPQWIRIAGDSINIKEDKPEHWQAYLGDSNKKIPLINWRITGNATTGNYLPNAKFKKRFSRPASLA